MQVRRATQEEVGLIFNCCPAVDQNVSDQCRRGLRGGKLLSTFAFTL